MEQKLDNSLTTLTNTHSRTSEVNNVRALNTTPEIGLPRG